MKTEGGSGYIDPRILELGISWSGQFHTPAALPPGTHWIGGWVGPRTGLDEVEKRHFLPLPGLEI
jgi:hypothetical protein